MDYDVRNTAWERHVSVEQNMTLIQAELDLEL